MTMFNTRVGIEKGFEKLKKKKSQDLQKDGLIRLHAKPYILILNVSGAILG